MMMHAPLLALSLLLLSAAGLSAALHGPSLPFVALGAALLTFLVGERTIAGFSAWKRFREPAGFWFPLAHLLRDLAWAAAIGMWTLRRLLGVSGKPQHSMRR